MSISVHRIVIHQIEKEQGVQEAHLKKSEELIDVDDNVEFLCDRLNDAFKKDEKVIKTEFIDTQEKVFQHQIKDYSSNPNNTKFYDLSIEAIDELRASLQGNPLAKGGYFVFAHFTYRNTELVAVFLVRDSEEVMFDRDPSISSFIVNKTTVIDTSKLAMACRIDLGKLGDNDFRYLHFTHRQTEISEYFINWIEASLADKSKEDSRNFLKLIDFVDLPLDQETNEVYDGDKLRANIFEYVKTAGKVVRVRDISKQFWDDSDYLSSLAEEKEITINQEFQAVNSIFQQLKKYELKSGRIKLSFAKGDYEQGTVRLGDENQIVIESQELRDKLEGLFNYE